MRPSRHDLFGQPALVTGAGGGIGRATCVALAAAGCEVVAVDIDEAAAKETVAACRGSGEAYHADVASAESVNDLAQEVLARHGTLGILVNNAGIGMTGAFLDTTLDDWRRIVAINLMGVVHASRAFVPAMLEARAGHVVNIASGLGLVATATEPAYCTTKAAVVSLSRSMRADWRPRGVSVSAVCPGVINTAILERAVFRGAASDPDAVARTKKMFRHGHPPELVARAIIGGVERDRLIVPVGIEARLGWMMRHLPAPAWDVLAGVSARLR